MKFLLRSRRERGAYTVTDAQRPMSEDIAYRQRRYLISMGIRVVAFLLAVFLFHGVWRFIAGAVALVVPYFAVVYANGGREPGSPARFGSPIERVRARNAAHRALPSGDTMTSGNGNGNARHGSTADDGEQDQAGSRPPARDHRGHHVGRDHIAGDLLADRYLQDQPADAGDTAGYRTADVAQPVGRRASYSSHADRDGAR